MSHPNPAINHLLQFLKLLLFAVGAVLFYHFLFAPLLPLFIAFLLSCMIVKPANWLHKHSRLPLGLCALLLTLGLVSLLLAGGWLLLRLITAQLKLLLSQIPAFVEGVQNGIAALQTRLQHWLPSGRNLPSFLSPAEWLAQLRPPEIDTEILAVPLGWAATSLPNLLLTTVFMLAATLLLVSHRDEILSFVKRQLPSRLLDALQKLRHFLFEALLGWCKAQGILSGITFLLLLTGFFFLRQQAALLLAVLIALLDALPVLGAGIALIPWALAELILGYPGRAAGIGLLYTATLAVRNLLEPHIVGRQIGLHPFLSLLGFYFGWKFAGVPGMFLFPCSLLILVKLQEWGYSKLWR